MATTTFTETLRVGTRQKAEAAGPTPWAAVVAGSVVALALVIGLMLAAGLLVPPHPSNAMPQPGFAYQSARPVISSGVRSSSTPVISRIVTSATQTTQP